MMSQQSAAKAPRSRRWILAAVIAVTAVATCAVTALLINVFERKDEGRTVFATVTEVGEFEVDPAVWGENFPVQYEAYLRTAQFTPTAHNKALVPREPTAEDPRTETTGSKLEEDPRLVTMWTGYAFAKDYRHLRGHEYMLDDQNYTLRVQVVDQPGACLNCHASTVSIMNDLGNGDLQAGFDAMNKMPYQDAAALAEHPVTCADCHDPDTMDLRITRPALMEGLKQLKASEGIADYDVNRDATRLEMRSYVCAQCHVEYYFKGEDKTLTFPWGNGTDINDVWDYYQEDGHRDFTHKVTEAQIVKAQHPEFETWAAGVHAQNGVSCADCHMSYQREGSIKVSNHQITTPMADVNGTCGTCHTSGDDVLKNRVTTIQNRFVDSRDRALDALVALIADIETGMANGTDQATLDKAREFQNFASFYVDYAYSENSFGFHAPDYMQRILSQSLDAARKGQLVLRGVPVADLDPSEVAATHSGAANASGLY
jgi:nitrite reductase (cytochrome c-552)